VCIDFNSKKNGNNSYHNLLETGILMFWGVLCNNFMHFVSFPDSTKNYSYAIYKNSRTSFINKSLLIHCGIYGSLDYMVLFFVKCEDREF